MQVKKHIIVLFCGILLLTGCSKYVLVSYNDVEKTNSVQLSLNSGNSIRGTVFRKEPHQLSLLQDDRQKALISKDNIALIKRLPPVYDSFGKGISEMEIELVKTSKNSWIYGVGGGALSMGASFFIGSMVAAGDSTNNGGAILAGTMGGLGIPATVLFIRAGAAKDRKDAIAKINKKRISAKIEQTDQSDPGKTDRNKLLQQEKEKQETLRKEHEKILKELGKKKK